MAAEDPMLGCQRAHFDLPGEIAYLNAAYMGPLPKLAVAAGTAGLARKAAPWRIRPADFFEESERGRTLFARLIGAEPDGIAIVPAASYGLAIAAANLPLAPGRRVLLLADQFPSNVYCWQRLAAERLGEVAFIEASADGDLTTALLAALDERTDIVAVPHCRWTDGRLVDLERIGARAREVGAALVVDATQSLGVLPLDVTRARPDFLVAAGYKWLLGPYSLGWLYVAPEWRAGRPLEANWIGRAGAEDFGRLVDYREDHAPGARRFDVGERSNFALLPAALASLELLLEWTPAALAERLAILTASIAERLAPLGLVTVPPQLRGPHFLGLALPDGAPADLTERLAAAGVFVSRRGSSLRVTPHAYNDEADVERLATALAGLL